MAYRSELEIEYGSHSFPIGAKCRLCGEEMPMTELGPLTPAETILWFAHQFSIHKSQKHSNGVLSNAL